MARNPETNENMREIRLERIRNAALELFASKGLSATKIQDIAKHSGMSQGLIYHYYASKEDIFVELMESSLDRIIDAVTHLKAMPLSASEKIKFAIDNLIQLIAEDDRFSFRSHLIQQGAFMEIIDDNAKDAINRKREIPYLEIEAIMAEGQRDGTIISGDAKELSILFWININGIALAKATHLDYFKIPRAETFYRLFFKGETFYDKF